MSEKNSKPKNRQGCLVKIVILFVAMLIGSAIQVAVSEPGAPTNPISLIITLGTVIGLFLWKPGNKNEDDTGIKPLDKNDSSEDEK